MRVENPPSLPASGLAALPNLLKRIPFFAALSESEIDYLSKLFYERQFSKGDYLFWEGDASDWMYIIKSGKVRVLKSAPTGKELVLEIMTPGDFCGGGAIFAEIQPASAQALTLTSTYGLRRIDFLQLLRSHPQVAQHVIVYLGKRLMSAHEMILSLITNRVEQRIAMALVRLAENHGTPTSQGIRINIKITRQNIADFVGSTVETTIRVMSRLKKQKIIGSQEGRIIIYNLDKLKEMQPGKGKPDIGRSVHR